MLRELHRRQTKGKAVAECTNGHDLTEEQLAGPCPMCQALPADDADTEGHIIETEAKVDFSDDDEGVVIEFYDHPFGNLMMAASTPFRVKSRKWWTDRKVNFDDLSIPVHKFFVHYLVARPKDLKARTIKAFLRGIEKFHMNKGYEAIAYPRIHFQNGLVVNGRPPRKRGGATYGNNSVSTAGAAAITVGNRPSENLVTSYVRSIKQLRRKGIIARKYVIWPHSRVRQTSCPGDEMRAKLPEIRRRVKG